LSLSLNLKIVYQRLNTLFLKLDQLLWWPLQITVVLYRRATMEIIGIASRHIHTAIVVVAYCGATFALMLNIGQEFSKQSAGKNYKSLRR
jgi:hypothetical protein